MQHPTTRRSFITAGSLGFLLLGATLAPTMHPERAFDEADGLA